MAQAQRLLCKGRSGAKALPPRAPAPPRRQGHSRTPAEPLPSRRHQRLAWQRKETIMTLRSIMFSATLSLTTMIASHPTPVFAGTSGTWVATGSMRTAHLGHTATLLNSGLVLVAGGTTGAGGALASAELYDAATGQWRPTGSMRHGRAYHTATLLAGGEVLVT